MLKLFGTALGAGVTSAVLAVVTTTQTGAGLVLAMLSPLPIMIVGFGFPPAVGAGAALTAAVGVAAAMGPTPALLFLALPALPSWIIAAVAARPRAPASAADAPARWTSVATLVLGLVAAAVLPVLAVAGVEMARRGGYQATLAWAGRNADGLLAGQRLPPGVTAGDVAQALPVGVAVMATLVLSANLWLAARSAQLSGWLDRSWPDIPDALRLPRTAAAALAVLGAAVLLPDPFGLAAAVVVGALVVAFAFEGLAVVHVLTRRLPVRFAVLVGVYLALLFREPWPFLVLVLAGCVDCLVPQVRRGAAVKITKLPKRRQ